MLLVALILGALTCTDPPRRADIGFFPRVEFDSTTYVFEGRVVGFATDSLTQSFTGRYVPERLQPGEDPQAAALLVVPITQEHLPVEAEVYSVFPYWLSDQYARYAFELTSALRARFEVGDRVAVAARENDLLTGTPSGAHPLVSPRHGGALLRVADLDPSDPDQIDLAPFSYVREATRPHVAYDEAMGAVEWAEEVARRATTDSAYADLAEPSLNRAVAWIERLKYEYERDLFRLHDSAVRGAPASERIAILQSVRAYWFTQDKRDRWRDMDCLYGALVENYLSEAAARAELGGRLLLAGLRPLPSTAACEAAERIRRERKEAYRRARQRDQEEREADQ